MASDDRWTNNPFLRIRPDGTVLFPPSWTEEARRSWLNEQARRAEAHAGDGVPTMSISDDISGTDDDR